MAGVGAGAGGCRREDGARPPAADRYVTSPRTEAVDDDWGEVVPTVIVDGQRFTPASLTGLEGFSHVEVVYLFGSVDPAGVQSGDRHPRGSTAWPEVGIFAQRAKNRPNRLGVSIARLLGMEGLTVTVQGLDAIDASPVLDLKPYLAELAPRGPVRQPAWATELMAGYWSTPHGGHDHAVLGAGHPRGISLELSDHGANVQSAPSPASLTVVVGRAAPRAHPAAPALALGHPH